MKTTINEKEIKLVSRNDVSVILSQKVAEMLSNGFIFYFYGGSQGEEGKVCLTNDDGKTVYVFWVHKEYESLSEKGWDRAEVLYITAKKYTDVYPGKTLWFNDGEKFFEQKWFKLDSKEERYVENLNDWRILYDIRSERRNLHYEMSDSHNTIKLSEKFHKIALKVIKNKKGYKSVSLKDIDHVCRRIGYGYIFCFTRNSRKVNFSVKLGK